MKSIKLFCAILLPGLLIILSSGCKKQETDKPNIVPEPIGEKTFKVGSYQTWTEVIDFANGNGYVVAGTGADSENEIHPFLALLNDSLRVTKVLYPGFTLNQSWTQGLAKLSDGYVILSTYAGNQDNTYGVYLTKISFTGSIIWEKEYFSGVLTWGRNISADSENSIVILCEKASAPDYNFYSRAVKLDSDGNILWSNDLYPGILNLPETIITDKQDNYIAVIDSITDIAGDRISVPVIHKINKSGTTLWTKALDSNNGRGWITRASIDRDNNIIIAYQPELRNVVLKIDPSGNILWETTLASNLYGFERMRDITVDNENTIYIIGDSKQQKQVQLISLTTDGEVLHEKLYNELGSEYYGNSIKYVSEKKLILLTTKFSPIEASVFYMTKTFDLL